METTEIKKFEKRKFTNYLSQFLNPEITKKVLENFILVSRRKNDRH